MITLIFCDITVSRNQYTQTERLGLKAYTFARLLILVFCMVYVATLKICLISMASTRDFFQIQRQVSVSFISMPKLGFSSSYYSGSRTGQFSCQSISVKYFYLLNSVYEQKLIRKLIFQFLLGKHLL